jgi:hypothetical protein
VAIVTSFNLPQKGRGKPKIRFKTALKFKRRKPLQYRRSGKKYKSSFTN